MFVILKFRYLKIKKIQRIAGGAGCPLVLLFLGDLKNCSSPGLRKPKRGGYEDRGGG